MSGMRPRCMQQGQTGARLVGMWTRSAIHRDPLGPHPLPGGVVGVPFIPATTLGLMAKYVYEFREGSREMKDLLGGKGANLAEMTNLGLPVPPGFTITTEACKAYLATGSAPQELTGEVTEHLTTLEQAMGKRLGQHDDPLLVSVRSGAKFSMPGMMDTVLNIGLSDESVLGLAKKAGSDRFAWDSYRRLIQMFGKTVLGIDAERFDEVFDATKDKKKVTNDLDLDESDLQDIVEKYKKVVKKHADRDFPQDPREQL